MKKKADKQQDGVDLRKSLEDAQHLFLAGFEKMTVAQDYALRKTVRQAGGNYQVVKNNVVQKAAEGTGKEPLFEKLAGMTSLAYTAGDPVALAKALTAYAKANPALTFKAGMVEGRVIDIAGIQDLSSMPSKEALWSKILWLINAPAQRLVTVINGVGRDLAVVIDQGVKEEKFTA